MNAPSPRCPCCGGYRLTPPTYMPASNCPAQVLGELVERLRPARAMG